MKKPSRRGVIEVRGLSRVLPRALKTGIMTMDLDDEVIVYDAKQHNGHCLNRPAAVVWQALDGETSMAELVAKLRAEVHERADEDTVWLALEELSKVDLLEEPFARPTSTGLSRRELLGRIGVSAALLPVILTVAAPPSHAQASAVGCSPADTCATFTCANGCACVPTTEGATVCIVPTCVAPCTTTADCPPGTVCFTAGCCGPATFCVPIAPAGTNCVNKLPGGAGPWQHVSA